MKNIFKFSSPSEKIKLRILVERRLGQLTTYGLPLCAIYWFYTICMNFDYTQLTIFIFFAYFLGLNTTAFMHRAWTHRAWVPTRYLNACALLVYSLGCTGKSISWCAVHRKHHRLSDTSQDPHSPYHKGKLYVMFSTYEMNFPADFEYAKDLLKDSIHLWFFKYYWFINFGLWLLLAIVDINLLVLWLGIIGFHGFKNKSMNVIGHNDPSTKESSNSIINSWLYLHGEPWHRNHHNNPTDWRFGHRWYEIDLGARLIQLCVFLGWGKLRSFKKE